jgi:hypothetical protein
VRSGAEREDLVHGAVPVDLERAFVHGRVEVEELGSDGEHLALPDHRAAFHLDVHARLARHRDDGKAPDQFQ